MTNVNTAVGAGNLVKLPWPSFIQTEYGPCGGMTYTASSVVRRSAAPLPLASSTPRTRPLIGRRAGAANAPLVLRVGVSSG